MAKRNYIKSNIKYLIGLRSLSQKEFAKQIGWSTTSVNNYVGGKAEPSADKLLELVDFFGITERQLIRINLAENGLLKETTSNAEESDTEALRLLLRMNNQVEELEGEVAKLKSERETAEEMREKLRERFPKQWQDIEKELKRG